MDPIDVLFSFDGRLNRKPFWLYQVGVAIVTSVPFILGQGWLTGLLQLWAQAALSVKRAHQVRMACLEATLDRRCASGRGGCSAPWRHC